MTTTGYYSKNFGYQDAIGTGGTVDIEDNLSLDGFIDMNGNDIRSAGNITATTCVKTPCIDSVGVAQTVKLGTANASTIDFDKPAKFDRLQSYNEDVIISEQKLIKAEKRITKSTTPITLTAGEIVDTTIIASGTALSFTFPDEADVRTYLGTVNDGVDQQTSFKTTIINTSAQTLTFTDGTNLLLGNAGRDMITEKTREIHFQYNNSGGGDIIAKYFIEDDDNNNGDQVVQNILYTDEIEPKTGGGTINISGTNLSAVGTNVLVKLGDTDGSPPTNTSSVVVEGKTDCLMLVQSDWDALGGGATSRFTNSLENNEYQSCFGVESTGLTSLRSSKVTGNTSIAVKVNGNHTRAVNSTDVNNATGYDTIMTFDGTSLNCILGPDSFLEFDNEIVIGSNSSASQATDIIIGSNSTSATGGDSIGIGNNVSAAGQDTICIGEGSSASFTGSISIGVASNSTGAINSIALGPNTSSASGTSSIVIGSGSSCSTFNNCVVLGVGAVASANNRLSIGSSTTALTTQSTVGSAGSGSTVPSSPEEYLVLEVNGNLRCIPLFATV